MGRPVIDPLTGDRPDLPARPSGAAGWSRDLPDHAPTSAGLALFGRLTGSLTADRGAADWTDADRFDKVSQDD